MGQEKKSLREEQENKEDYNQIDNKVEELRDILNRYIRENEGKAFTVQALFNRINELELNEQSKSKITPEIIEQNLNDLEKRGYLTSEQRGAEKFYFTA